MKYSARLATVFVLLGASTAGAVLESTPASASSCSSKAKTWDPQSGLSYRDDGTFCMYDEAPGVGSATKLIFQSDGNLVEYYKGKPIGATGTNRRGRRLALQTDGNIVVYDSSHHALWASGRWGTIESTSTFRLSVDQTQIEQKAIYVGGGGTEKSINLNKR